MQRSRGFTATVNFDFCPFHGGFHGGHTVTVKNSRPPWIFFTVTVNFFTVDSRYERYCAHPAVKISRWIHGGHAVTVKKITVTGTRREKKKSNSRRPWIFHGHCVSTVNSLCAHREPTVNFGFSSLRKVFYVLFNQLYFRLRVLGFILSLFNKDLTENLFLISH